VSNEARMGTRAGATSFTPDPSWPSIEELAKERWGEPNADFSRRDDIRFGAKGSKSVKPSANIWHDHETDERGGYVDLHLLVTGELPNGGTPYDYRDPSGALLFQVVRKTPKGFYQRRPDGNGGWINNLKGVRRIPYRLPELLAADPGEPVFITEGEKDADNLRALGLIATTNAGGAGKWSHDFAKLLTGRDCIVLPDNDDPGREHAETVRRSLSREARSVRVLTLPGLPPKGDVTDWLRAGGTAEGLRAMLREPEPEPKPEAKPLTGRILTGADFIASHVPPVWLIDGIVQRSRLYACTSLTGHGKTAVWLFNACMIHASRMIGQLDAFPGNVLILAGENPADLQARMIGMALAYNLPRNRLPYVLPGSFPMTEDEADALKRVIAGLGVPLAMIVGDTASSFFPGEDENSNVQAGTYARTLRSLNECEGSPAIVALCHPTKGASRGNLLPRGGGAFLNELDGNLALWSDSLGEVTELHWCGKIRGPDFSPIGYRLRPVPTGLTDEKDRPEMTIVAEPMSEEAVADHTKQTLANEDVVLLALRDHPDWSYAQMAREAGWVDGADQPMKPRVQRAIRSLAEDKLVTQPRKGARWELTEKGEKAVSRPDTV
jgi:hypothetical protein